MRMDATSGPYDLSGHGLEGELIRILRTYGVRSSHRASRSDRSISGVGTERHHAPENSSTLLFVRPFLRRPGARGR